MYHPVQDLNTGETLYWVDNNGEPYPENPDHVKSQIAEFDAYMESLNAPADGGVDDWGVPYDTKWNALFE